MITILIFVLVNSINISMAQDRMEIQKDLIKEIFEFFSEIYGPYRPPLYEDELGGKKINLDGINLMELPMVEDVMQERDSIIYKYSLRDRDITVKELADILAPELELTYNNYQYYRSHIGDSANRNILKLYSEGILKTDSNGNINPSKILSKDELLEISQRLDSPQKPQRPAYINKANIPILMYHEINPLPKNGPTGLYVSQENFKKQLDALKEKGYSTITMEQLHKHWNNKTPLPAKPIVLTFDDGYASHYNFAYKEMSKRGMTGTFYIITSMVGTDTIRTREGLQKMYNAGMEIGSHSVTHMDARYNSNDKVLEEWKVSQKFLQDTLGVPIEHFCYPIGGVTPYARQTLKNLGYKTAVRTSYGKANKAQGMYDLKRIRMDYKDSIAGFLNKIK